MGLFDQINTATNFDEDVTREKHLPAVSVKKGDGNRHVVRVELGAQVVL